MRKLILKLLINALALLAAAEIVSGITLSRNILDLTIVALIFGLVNILIKPLVKLFALPLFLLTLGLITFVVNALMLLLTAALSSSLSIHGFWPALWGSIIISIVSMVLSHLFKKEIKRTD